MSKTTKIIAALGVVAGLGVAALPAFTYATESVSGQVEVDVEVESAIAMTIVGNNDDGSIVPSATQRYTAVTPEGTENPSEEGWYEESGGEYTRSIDTTVDSGKTYYAQSSGYNQVDAFSPAEAASSKVDTHDTPSSSINALSSSAWTMLPNDKVEGDNTNGFRSTITVYTNNASGFQLSVKDADTTTDLSNRTDTIPTGAGAVVAGTAKWNFDTTILDGAAGGVVSQTAVAMPASDGTAVVIDNYGSKTNGGRASIVDYNVSTKADQQAGIYRDTIVYTATTN